VAHPDMDGSGSGTQNDHHSQLLDQGDTPRDHDHLMAVTTSPPSRARNAVPPTT
jgi:hypothetical protein